jgi:hypothetical protein
MSKEFATKCVRACLIDDNQHDREFFARRLSKPGVLSIDPLPYVKEDFDAVENGGYDVVLVDYQLIEGKSAERTTPRLGSTLSAYFRERMPDTPLLLITRGSLFRNCGLVAYGDETATFDDILVKDEIRKSPAIFREGIVTIVRGFESLRSVRRYRAWNSLCKILAGTDEESRFLRDADPPPIPKDGKGWRVPDAARWIRKTLIRYPGVLYDSLHAACSLGLAESSFMTSAVQEWFKPARYIGPFSSGNGVWWKQRLLVRAFQFLSDSGQQGTATYRFCAAWNAVKKTRLQSSRCVEDGSRPAECVCYILRKPVKRSNSLPYRPDNRPRAMEEARVSFRAIRESNDFNEKLVAPDALHLVRSIQRESRNP